MASFGFTGCSLPLYFHQETQVNRRLSHITAYGSATDADTGPIVTTLLASGKFTIPVLLDSDDVVTDDEEALRDDELLELDTVLKLELETLDAVLRLLTVLKLELETLDTPNSSSLSIPRGSVSIALTSTLVLMTLENCPLCRYNLFPSLPHQGVSVPSKLTPVAAKSTELTSKLALMTLEN